MSSDSSFLYRLRSKIDGQVQVFDPAASESTAGFVRRGV